MIEVGARVPDAEVFILDSGAPKAVRMTELCAGKRVALFGVPGAFTRTCSGQHLPGMVASADALGAKGVDLVACLAVNDVFVLAAWSREHDAGGKVTMISDGSLNFTRAAGLEADMSDRGFGLRARRFSMLIEDGTVTRVHIEQPGAFGETSAEALLAEI